MDALPNLPSSFSPKSLAKPPHPSAEFVFFDQEGLNARDSYFDFPKAWRKMFQKPKRIIYSPPRMPESKELPLKKAKY